MSHSLFILFKHRRRTFENGSRFEKRIDPDRSEFAPNAGMLEPAEARLLIV
jgi:hypothetical protein